MAARMEADEAAVAAYFSQYLKPDKLQKCMLHMGYIRTVVSGRTCVYSCF
jgi:hypothetical protein